MSGSAVKVPVENGLEAVPGDPFVTDPDWLLCGDPELPLARLDGMTVTVGCGWDVCTPVFVLDCDGWVVGSPD